MSVGMAWPLVFCGTSLSLLCLSYVRWPRPQRLDHGIDRSIDRLVAMPCHAIPYAMPCNVLHWRHAILTPFLLASAPCTLHVMSCHVMSCHPSPSFSQEERQAKVPLDLAARVGYGEEALPERGRVPCRHRAVQSMRSAGGKRPCRVNLKIWYGMSATGSSLP